MMQWKAFYSDGSTLDQYGINGKSGYENIDRSKLIAFAIIDKTWVPDRNLLIPLMNSDYKIFSETAWHVPVERIIFRMHLEPGQRLIYRLLGAKKLFARTLTQVAPDEHYIMVGWQQKIGDKNVQSITYITPDGRIEQTGKFLGGAPNLLPGEKDG